MRFSSPLIPGRLIKRYKRFLSDIELENGEVVTAHCANPGSMLGCNACGAEVLLSRSDNPKRKLQYSWELVKVGRSWVCINTALPNAIVREAIENEKIPELSGYDSLKPEVKYGENSRVDLLLTFGGQLCYVEIKSVTLASGRVAQFPDSVTSRGTKHLNELARMVEDGHRAVMFFLVNRGDCNCAEPAAHIDPVYAKTLAAAADAGVEIVAYRSKVRKAGISVKDKIPFRLKTS
ncbi:MAG: DNA/RNA nuclease SfsA [Planctomycetota bacterium]|jgi:sugar fermentation stimulation protein A|nr:DNA/RNA nuclease SfsA [Planctomycetota bacterium]MDP6505300.1 DNA/RNA nuclease SfsA [Planctomycetota bacterium]